MPRKVVPVSQGTSRTRKYAFPAYFSPSERRRNEQKDRFQALEAENQALKVERDKAHQEVRMCRKIVVDSAQRIASLEAELRKEKDTSGEARKNAASSKHELEEILPLVKIGERVRLRFLEQERLSYWANALSRDQLQQDKIDQGNEAAHGGNGLADAALLSLLQKRGDDIEGYKAMFCTMYCCQSLDAYLTRPSKLKRTLDLRVSIQAGIGINGGIGTEQQRNDAIEILDEVLARFNSLGFESAEQDLEVDRWLAKAEDMKKELLKTYKQRNNRR